MSEVSVKVYGPLALQLNQREVKVEAEKIKDIFISLDNKFGTNSYDKITTDEQGRNISGDMQVVIDGKIERDLEKRIKFDRGVLPYIKIIPLAGGG
ncbi:hypothetical protein AKJ39_00965 [candidate division MSBL1 archaeon SCGC-AAA259J03]|uniref:Molybdopterin synthase sulfur carrier subunit n=1 Tax=candidate division MSBL1 archaeon SCGC-AAA259J03 TaxID=1698269 RepID=A0A656YWZ2_9EURY|nr:hypothetical protein AKJ39_00965 [candidate division MSBL1 archaeon SCGC-AAA259J03]